VSLKRIWFARQALAERLRRQGKNSTNFQLRLSITLGTNRSFGFIANTRV
jgi:uncharacterized Tic20 family protein